MLRVFAMLNCFVSCEGTDASSGEGEQDFWTCSRSRAKVIISPSAQGIYFWGVFAFNEESERFYQKQTINKGVKQVTLITAKL